MLAGEESSHGLAVDAVSAAWLTFAAKVGQRSSPRLGGLASLLNPFRRMSGTIPCPVCGSESQAQDGGCGVCGFLADAVAQSNSGSSKCARCGSALPQGFDFCPVCGQDQRERMRRPPTEQMRIDLVPSGGTPQAPAPLPTPVAIPPAMANANPSMTMPAPSASSPSPIPPSALAAQGAMVPSDGYGYGYAAPAPGVPTPVPRKKTPLAGLTVPAPGSGLPPAPIPGVVHTPMPMPTPPDAATAAGRTVVAPPQTPSNAAAAQRVGRQDLPFSPFDGPTGPKRDSIPPIVSREHVDEDLTERHHQADLRRAAASDIDKTVPHSQASLPQSREVGDDDKTVPHPSMNAPRPTKTLAGYATPVSGGADKTRPDRPGEFSGGPAGQMASPQVNTPQAGPGTPGSGPSPMPESFRVTTPGRMGARLVIVSRDGSEGEAFPFVGQMMTIGRTHGDLLFPEDPFLSPVHVRLQMTEAGKILLVDAGTTNGVYLKIRGHSPVYPGDHFMVGHQLLRLENLDGQVQETPAGLDGTRMFGTPLQPAWGRLTQVGRGGMAGDKFYLRGARVVIGREDGDLTFPNDPYVSREHASLRLEINGAAMAVYLEDLESANGTYVRIRGSAELSAMDTFRVGDQILRLRLD